MSDLTIPFHFEPREYQKDFWLAIQDKPADRAVIVWPRRHGKDKTMVNALLLQMLKRVANYYYVFPEFNQGRKALWDNLDSNGFKTMDHIPQELRKRTDQQQMKIELYNGSIFQIIGASDIDRIVGTNPAGIIFSEYSLMSPNIIGYLLPIVVENKGFMWFNFTPRGDNHARTLYQQAVKNGWFVSYLTARDAGQFSEQELEEIKIEYKGLYGDERLFNQEFLCSFDEPIQGSYYGDLITLAEETDRITDVPYRQEHPVHTYWDLGVGDATGIWFAQFNGDKVNLIDYYEGNGKGLDHYIKVLQNKPYVYGQHFAPHDIKVREFGSGLSRVETARNLGINFRVAPKLKIEDGINATRILLQRCYFDKKKCEVGLACLKNYHRKYNEETRVFDNKPLHDWSSNGADAFRYLAVSVKQNQISDTAVYDDIPDYARSGFEMRPREDTSRFTQGDDIGFDSNGFLR